MSYVYDESSIAHRKGGGFGLAPGTDTNMSNRTPAAAAMRSTLRRLRDIAEV